MKNLSLALAAMTLLAGSGAYAQTQVITAGPIAAGSCATAAPVYNTGYRLPGTGIVNRLLHPTTWFSAGVLNTGINFGGTRSAGVIGAPAVSYNGMRTLTQSALIGGTNSLFLAPPPALGFDQAGRHLPMANLDIFGRRLIRLGPTIPSDMEKRI